jgi:hypothetical protein
MATLLESPTSNASSIPDNPNASESSHPIRILKAKDLEAIRRLMKSGNRLAAMKIYSGAMDVGMSEAASSINRLA